MNDGDTAAAGSEGRRAKLLGLLGAELRAFHAGAAIVSQVVADRLGIGTTDIQCLNVLGARGPLSAGQLADLTGLATGTVTGVVDRLETAGYVRRERDTADRRRVMVVPLPLVRDRVSPLFGSIRRATAEHCARYDEDQLATIVDFLVSSRQVFRDETDKLRQPRATGRASLEVSPGGVHQLPSAAPPSLE